MNSINEGNNTNRLLCLKNSSELMVLFAPSTCTLFDVM